MINVSFNSLFLALVMLFYGVAGYAQQDGFTDSQCLKLTGTAQDYIWTLDSNAASNMNLIFALQGGPNGITNVSQTELMDHIDGLLESIAVEGRPLMRQRLRDDPNASCNRGDDGCIFFEIGSGGLCDGNSGPTMYTSPCLFGDECAITVCLPKLAAAAASTRMLRFSRIMKHEFGHALGGNHVHKKTGSSTVAGCPGVNTPRPSCDGNTDGVDGELMSTRTQCAMGTQLRAGDGHVFRRWFNDQASGTSTGDYTARKLFTAKGSSAPTNFDQLGSRSVIFRPRIDCATEASPEYNCVITQSYASGANMSTKIVGLRNLTSNGLWGTNSSRFNHVQDLAFEGDIAISPNGEKAFFVYAAEKSNNTWVRVVDLSSTNSDYLVDLGYQSAYTPRIAINAAENMLVVIGYEVLPGNTDPERYGFKFHPVVHVAPVNLPQTLKRISTTGAEAIMEEVQPHMSWDFDCSDVTNMCVVVGMFDRFLTESGSPRTVGRYRSTRFTLDGLNVAITSRTLTPASARSSFTRIEGVSGVDLKGSNNTLTVSASRRVSGGSSGNTRVAKYTNGRAEPGFRFSQGYYISDAQTCSNGTYDGNIITSGFSTWGGYDVAFGTGLQSQQDYVSAHVGRQSNGSTFCH